MGRLARHRKIKQVNKSVANNYANDPARNKAPSRKEEEEFRKIMMEWNKPAEKKKQTQTQTQTPVQIQPQSFDDDDDDDGQSLFVAVPSSTDKKKNKNKRNEIAGLEPEVIAESTSVAVPIDDLLQEKEDEDEMDGKKKKKKKKGSRAIGKIVHIDVKHDELDKIANPEIKYSDMKPGESLYNYKERLKREGWAMVAQHAQENKKLRPSRKKHLQKRDEMKKKKKKGLPLSTDSSEHHNNNNNSNFNNDSDRRDSSDDEEVRTDIVRFGEQAQEPPKLQAPLRKKKKEMLEAKRALEKASSSSTTTTTTTSSDQTEDDLEKIRVAQRSMQLMKERIINNYKMSKQREKQKREVAIGAQKDLLAASASKKTKKPVNAPTYL
eukprot:TRINITY_DN2859_c0_g1_i1.p1 TRINITY_DN2859_c0_g1~~TRINITY_DN2859_c0_g1_i1.p1  ORF type:complete len:390 (+),score=152.91 TRINITY_DN2859_c0_g1_i1:31-1170(+)